MLAGGLLHLLEAVAIGHAVLETQRVGRHQVGQELLEGIGVHELLDAGAGVDAVMEPALGTDVQVVGNVLGIDSGPAGVASRPEAGRYVGLLLHDLTGTMPPGRSSSRRVRW